MLSLDCSLFSCYWRSFRRCGVGSCLGWLNLLVSVPRVAVPFFWWEALPASSCQLPRTQAAFGFSRYSRVGEASHVGPPPLGPDSLPSRLPRPQSSFGFSGNRRIGEASNPGPSPLGKDRLVLFSVNLTDFLKRVEDIRCASRPRLSVVRNLALPVPAWLCQGHFERTGMEQACSWPPWVAHG